MGTADSNPLLSTWPRLRDLGLAARLGIACLCLTVLGGLAASAQHLINHHEMRDEQPGVSMDDLRGAYHGVQTTSGLVLALERGHPDSLPKPQRETLLKWLRGERVAENYDNLDLGDSAPNEIISRNCLSCHGKKASNPIAKTVPLDYWDDVKKFAVSRKVEAVPLKVLTASTHTHALGLGSLTFIAAGLMLCTWWPRRLCNVLILLAGAGLLLDIGAWWLSRESAAFVYLVVGAGAAFNGSLALMMGLVLLDLFRPKK
jgi:hypothetical protein